MTVINGLGALGVTNWTQVANAASGISSAIQSGATAYTTVVNSLQKPYNSTLQQYLQPGPSAGGNNGGGSNDSNNTLIYVVVGGVGLLAVSAIAIIAAKSKKKG